MFITRPITNEERLAYERYGVVCLHGVVASEQLEMLRAAIDDATRTLASSPAGYGLNRIRKAIEIQDLQSLQDELEDQRHAATTRSSTINAQNTRVR